MRPTRRNLLRAFPALLGAGMLLPSGLRADSSGERKFLFVFCPGGWDPAWALAPVFGSVAAMPDGATLGSANGIDFVNDPQSPAVGSFFADWGQQTCMLHGIESRSVAHDVCLRLILTGSNLPGADDWPLKLAALSGESRVMPYVNLSGPTYAGSSVSSLVRVGENGQLAALLDGTAITSSDLPVALPNPDRAALVDALLATRLDRLAAEAGSGRAADIAAAAGLAESRRAELAGIAAELDLAGGVSLRERAGVGIECLRRGLSRVAMVEYYGLRGLTWDTHGAQVNQSGNFQELFSELSLILADLAATPGSEGGSLAEEVTVVVMSEMGRYPLLNSRAGKEHWTYTSALLIGAGVRGGQSIGGYDPDSYLGKSVNLADGGDGDVALNPNHLGATLLALGGHDAAALLPDADPISAAIEEA
jgi:uncharacterized protein (DUF1501 family)